jgi:hypothetical protein
MKRRTKIGLVLLIALAFILPTVPLSAESPTRHDADTTPRSPIPEAKTDFAPFKTAEAGIAALDYVNGWPIIVNDIFINPVIPAGDYPITAEFCRPDYKDGVDWTVIATDTTMEFPSVPTIACNDVIWREDGATYTVWGDFCLTLDVDDATDVITLSCNNPAELNGRWETASERLYIYRDYDSDGTCDWAMGYKQTGAFEYWTYDGAVWTLEPSIPGIFSVSYASSVFTVSWTDTDGVATGRCAANLREYHPAGAPGQQWHYMNVPYRAAAYPDADDTSNWIDVPQFHKTTEVTVSMKSDCDTVWIEFVASTDINTIDVMTQGGNNFDETYGGVAGIGTDTVVFTIPRTELRVGACNQLGFWLNYDVNGENTGSIARSTIVPIVVYDCGSAWIKKFYEIYEWRLVREGDPITETEIYCTDFEDPCDFYDEWATLDMMDSTYNGAIDTWVWTDKRSNSPTHSFHSTSGDTYLPNQYDILRLAMDGAFIDVSAYAGEQIRLEFSHFMRGDSIVIDGNRFIQDGGQVMVDFDVGTDWSSEVFYDNDWTDESFTIDVPVGATTMILDFVFWSDPAFCYEGWYVDDVCLTGIIGGSNDVYDWFFVTDGHSQEQEMTEECLEHTFDEIWHAEEGLYKICVWLQALDDCHRAVNGSGVQGFADSGPYCIEVEVADLLCLAEIDLDFSPSSPAWEGDDVTIISTVENVGTLDATDIQVQVTINRGSISTTFTDGVESGPYDPSVYDTDSGYGTPAQTTGSWHITTLDAYSGSHAWMWSNPDEVSYQVDVGYDGYLPPHGYANAPLGITFGIPFTENDAALQPLLRFKTKYAFAPGDFAAFGIYDPNDPGGDTTFIRYGYNVGFISQTDPDYRGGIQTTWQTWEYDPVPLLNAIAGGGYVDGDDLMMGLGIYTQPTSPGTSGESFSGILIDDVEVVMIQAGEEIIYQDVQILPMLNASDFWTPGEIKDVEFTWENAGAGQYVVTQEILTEDCDPSDNSLIAPYNVINYELTTEEDGEIEFIDHTCGDEGGWIISDCCDSSFWAGDPATTMYLNNMDEVLQIAPGGEKVLVGAGGKNLVYETWYQLNVSDYGLVEYSPDGLHWYTLATITGALPTMDGEMNPTINSVMLPMDTQEVRFRFVSNNTTTNRGWFISHVFIDGVIDDDCESFDNFLNLAHCFGNWWQSPDAYYNTFGYTMTDWAFFYPGTSGWMTPDDTYGCYDPLRLAAWPFYGAYGFTNNEIYPMNIDNSFNWKIDVDKVFYGWFNAIMGHDVPGGDDALYSFSVDGVSEALPDPGFLGTYNAFPENFDGAEGIFQIRMTSDDVANVDWDGVNVNELTFYGMKDNTAPTTTIIMDGNFDDVYDYYTSEVAVVLNAEDDITGVAATYYELDGTQYTYDRPFIIEGDGEHTLCYWSVDNEGNVETKQCVAPFRIDETGPSVEITGPAPGIYLFGNKLLDSDKYVFLFGGFEVTATVDVDEAPLATVEFYFNDVLVGEDTTAPFKLKIAEKNSGGCTIKVVAIDVLGEDDEDTLEIDTYLKLF